MGNIPMERTSKSMADLSKETILELQHIFKEEYGREISFAEASEIANGLVGYFDTLAKVQWKIDSDKGEPD